MKIVPLIAANIAVFLQEYNYNHIYWSGKYLFVKANNICLEGDYQCNPDGKESGIAPAKLKLSEAITGTNLNIY